MLKEKPANWFIELLCSISQFLIFDSDIEAILIGEMEIWVEIRVVESGQDIYIFLLIENIDFLVGVHDDDGHKEEAA